MQRRGHIKNAQHEGHDKAAKEVFKRSESFKSHGQAACNKRGSAVCAEIITELILERAGPVIFETFLLEFIPVRLIPVICLQEEQSLKITGNDN